MLGGKEMKRNILLSNLMNSDRAHALLMNTPEICDLRASLFEMYPAVSRLQFISKTTFLIINSFIINDNI
jgi:hypothetical protein